MLLAGLATVQVSHAAESDRLVRVTVKEADQPAQEVDGKIVVEAQDGGVLLLARDGRLWNVTPQEMLSREATDTPFEPFSAEELGTRLQAEMGDGFEVTTTAHYVICSNAGTHYSRWCGALFERLMSAFRTHWRTRKLGLEDPGFPLAAIVLADQQQFAQFATRDVGPAFANVKGYYSTAGNRIVLYDLTAAERSSVASVDDVNRRLAAAPFNVATIVHEATHQIAFNSGMHRRYADNPLWMTEGMAMYFETPDLESRNGWKTVGRPNTVRLQRFAAYARQRRKADALASLIGGSERFRNAKQAEDAYAEAWALTYFLIKTRRDDYVEYLRRIADKPVLRWDDSESRLAEFRAVFGDDLQVLDRQFMNYLRRVRPGRR